MDAYQDIFGCPGDPEATKIQDAKAKDYEDNYCSQNDHDCETCSLVNYGRDCHNNPLGVANNGIIY